MNTTTATTAIVDLTDPTRCTRPARCLAPRPDAPVRRAAARPDGVVSGGSGMEEDRHHVSPHAEIYRPTRDTNTWLVPRRRGCRGCTTRWLCSMPDGKVSPPGPTRRARRGAAHRGVLAAVPVCRATPRVTPRDGGPLPGVLTAGGRGCRPQCARRASCGREPRRTRRTASSGWSTSRCK